MAEKNNLALWERRGKTDPRWLKAVEFGRKFTSVDAQSQLREATDEFGPYGYGFGVKDAVYGYVRDAEGHIISATLEAKFWYVFDGATCQTEASIDITPFYNKKGPVDDHRKKLLTGLITKELSRLGFNSDLFMGMWDGCPYIGKDAAKAEQWRDGAPKATVGPTSAEAFALLDAVTSADKIRPIYNAHKAAASAGGWLDQLQAKCTACADKFNGGPGSPGESAPPAGDAPAGAAAPLSLSELLEKVAGAKATPHLDNVYNAYKGRAEELGKLDFFAGQCDLRRQELLDEWAAKKGAKS